MNVVAFRDPRESSAAGDQSSRIHERLVDWAAQRARSDYECGVLLLAAARSNVHRVLGFASVAQYGAAVTGMTERQARERLRVAKALEDLPELAESFRQGRMTFSKVRELTRVVTPTTESTWVAEAESLTSAAVQELCSGRQQGDGPDAAARPEARRYRLEFENVDADVKALLAEARRVLTEEAGESLDDSQFLRALSNHVLRGDSNPERASYQVAVSECSSCGAVRQRAGGKPVVVDAAVAERARCDARDIGHVDAASPERASQLVPPSVRRQVLARHDGCCAVPGCRHSAFVDVHHVTPRCEGGGHDPDNLVALCSNHHDLTHRGRLLIRGTYSTGLVFQRADGVNKTRLPSRSASMAGELGQAFEALKTLGFKSTEAQQMLDAIRNEVPQPAGVSEVVHAALRALPTRKGSYSRSQQKPRRGVRDRHIPYERAA